MEEKVNLFITLVKLKFYLVSLLDSPMEKNSFYFTEEFLERRIPELKDDLISSLKKHGISGDSEIAFDDSAIVKFRQIVKEKESAKDLPSILKKLEIESRTFRGSVDDYRTERDKQANEILDKLFQLSSNWILHKELENRFEDYSILDEEDVIRPEEAERLSDLNTNTDSSFGIITNLTNSYITLLADYYFKYGGDLQLKEFWMDLEKIKFEIQEKYKELFKSFGLDLNS
jgi:hypothetical protein